MNGYDDDEYYEDQYEDDGIGRYSGGRSETSYSTTLVKAQNGHLAVHQGCLTRYPGEDWGEASGWSECFLRLCEIDPEYKKHAIEVGRGLKPGESTPFYPQYMEEETE